MSASFRQKTTNTTGTTNPVTISVTTTSNDHVLVLFLVVASATTRTGGTPTWNGNNMTQLGSTAQAASAPETSAEIWYYLNPTATTADVSIPNAGGLTIRRHVATFTSSSGKFKAGTASTNSGTSTNPSITVNVPYNESVWVSLVGTGATTWSPSAQDGTVLYNVDHGANGIGSQYGIKDTAGDQSMGWTEASNDDWAIVAGSFGVSPPTVALSSPSDAGSTSDTTPDLVFTGTDPEGEDVSYEVQVDTVNTFNSQTGSPFLIESYSKTNQDSTLAVSGASTYSKIGQAFTATAGVLQSCKFYLSKTSTPTGNAVAKLYSATGTLGSNAAPTGAALATSDNFDVSTLTGSLQLITFTFSTGYTLVAGTNYVITFEYSGTDGDVNVGRDASTPTHAGNYSRFDSAWTGLSAADLVFYVYTENKYPLIDKLSASDSGFSGSPDNSDPFASGQAVTYTVQSALTDTVTYYWRVRGKDTNGTNSWGPWSSTRSFTVNIGGGGAVVKDIIGTGVISFPR